MSLMNNFKKTTILSNHLMVDDYIKIAGVLYRVTRINRINQTYDISFHNARRPILKGTMTLERNTLMKIWNQKY